MAKLIGPLLSFGAKGQIGKAMVVAKWRGVDYARQYVIPANPQTTAQQANRVRFALLREMWKLAPAVLRAPWDAFATGRPFLGLNKFVGENNRLLNGETDMLNFLGSPGARGGLPPDGITVAATANPGELSITVDVPAILPDGWSVTGIGACAFPDQDPVGLFVGPLLADFEAGSVTPVVIAGLPATTLCNGVGWIEYEKPDGSAAYSVSLLDQDTTA